jgi:hypothetical protein
MQKNEATVETLEIVDENTMCEKHTSFICHEVVDRIIQYALLIIVLYVVYMSVNTFSRFIFHTMELEEKVFLHKHLRHRNSIYLNGNW